MPWIRKFNFRATDTFGGFGLLEAATTDETYVLGNENHPTVRQGVTFGYTSGGSAVNPRDRASGVDRRLAGTHFRDNATVIFRVDLPAAGPYLVGLSVGDEVGFTRDDTYTEVLDDTTSRVLIDLPSGFTNDTQNHRDANGVLYSAAGWVAAGPAGTLKAATFATTILNVQIGTAVRVGFLAHLYIEQVEAAPPAGGGGAYDLSIRRTRWRR